jgi:hypothetical protein
MPSGKLQQNLTGNPKWRTQSAKTTVLTLKPTVKDSPAIYVVYSGVRMFSGNYLSSTPRDLRARGVYLELKPLIYIYRYFISAPLIRVKITPVKDSHTRTKPLSLASGHGRYISVTNERTPVSVGEWPLHIYIYILYIYINILYIIPL